MKKIKCCYCNNPFDPKKGVMQHDTTKKYLCIRCVAMSLAGFLTGIAPCIHEHTPKEPS